MRDLNHLIDEVDKVVPGLKESNAVLEPLMRSVCELRLPDEHRRAVIAMCEVTIEMYAGVLAAVAQRLGVPAEALGRTLFETSVSVVYLAKDSSRYRDFLQHGIMVHYEILRDIDAPGKAANLAIQNELAMRQNDYNAIKASFDRHSQWYKRKVKDIVEDAGFGQLYRTFYKESSSMCHGDSFLIIRRRHLQEWDIAVDRALWDRYIGISAHFSFLLMSTMFDSLNAVLDLGCGAEAQALAAYIRGHPEYAIR